ncbi:MAG: hypothetical protein MZV70_50240 [Desulfobacterales bacterium]|nr:hypothetical protein [Desulfobacterales bacterium]
MLNPVLLPSVRSASKEQIKAMKAQDNFFEAQADSNLVDMIRADTHPHQLIVGNRKPNIGHPDEYLHQFAFRGVESKP